MDDFGLVFGLGLELGLWSGLGLGLGLVVELGLGVGVGVDLEFGEKTNLTHYSPFLRFNAICLTHFHWMTWNESVCP